MNSILLKNKKDKKDKKDNKIEYESIKTIQTCFHEDEDEVKLY